MRSFKYSWIRTVHVMLIYRITFIQKWFEPESSKTVQNSHLRPRRVLPHSWATVPPTDLPVTWPVLVAAVLTVHSLGLAVGPAPSGTVDFDGLVSQTARGRAIAFTSHVPTESKNIQTLKTRRENNQSI